MTASEVHQSRCRLCLPLQSRPTPRSRKPSHTSHSQLLTYTKPVLIPRVPERCALAYHVMRVGESRSLFLLYGSLRSSRWCLQTSQSQMCSHWRSTLLAVPQVQARKLPTYTSPRRPHQGQQDQSPEEGRETSRRRPAGWLFSRGLTGPDG